MTPSEKLSQLAADKLFGPHDNEGAKIIEQHCCLLELLEVARAAKEFVGGFYKHVNRCNCEHCALLKSLATLRSKLKEKGVEL